MTAKNTHSVLVTVRFDKKCSQRVALREVRDEVHGLHYCTVIDDGDPETFKIKSVRPLGWRRRQRRPAK